MCALRREPPPRDSQLSLYKISLGRAKLWLNDLDDLVRLLESRTKKVRLRAGDAIADSVEDLPDATSKELRQVAIVTADPFVMVRLSVVRPEVLTLDNSDEAQVLVDDVAALLRARKTLLPSL